MIPKCISPKTETEPGDFNPRLQPYRSAFLIGTGALLIAFLTWRLFTIGQVATHVDDLVPLAEYIRQLHGRGTSGQIIDLSRFYTFPPGQFLISLPLSRLAGSTEEMIFWFRLPSFLFWLIGLVGGYFLILSVIGQANRSVALLAILPALLSWRGIIESSQGYNYATTLPSCVLIAALCLTERGQRLHRHPAGAIIAGLLMGLACWFTYQAIFIGAASLAFIGVRSLQRRATREILAAVVAGLSFAVPVGLVYHLCLRHAFSFASGTPGWAGGIPGSELTSRLLFPFRAWFLVLENNFTFVPWGLASTALGSIFLGVIALGVLRIASSRERAPGALGAASWLACVALVFTAGPYLEKFPLGATRHSFVLQWPLVLLWAVSLAALRPSVRSCKIAGAVLVVLFFAALPSLRDSVRGRVDVGLIEHYLDRYPNSRVVDLPGSFTWDFTLVAAKNPEQFLPRMRWNNQFASLSEMANFLAQAEISFAVSHRGPLSPDLKTALTDAGIREIIPLCEFRPRGSNELSGNINGGNGFFFYQLRR